MSSITGEECAVSGIYRSSGGCGHTTQRPISKAERFAPCPHCDKAVIWTLVKPSARQGVLDAGLSDVTKKAGADQPKPSKNIKSPNEALGHSPQKTDSSSTSIPATGHQQAAKSTAEPQNLRSRHERLTTTNETIELQ
jgi:hypothetical protein